MTGLDIQTIDIEDFWPDRATYRPGEPVTVCARVLNTGADPVAVVLDLRVMHLDRLVQTHFVTHWAISGESVAALPLDLPPDGFRGYGVDIRILDAAGAVRSEASTALDVLDNWTDAPRYGFLSDFAPGSDDATAVVGSLARYHVNVVQFYDWMWRHYALMPPASEFADALGRKLSLGAVRAKIAACHTLGMAALGYAAVYGAEPEYALQHADEVLYDAAGEPYSLEKLFYIMNIHAGNTWRNRILAEMQRAVAEVPFDGLHLDQYGFPMDQAFGPPPECRSYRLDQDFPSFVDDARAAIRAKCPGTRVIFNAVDNWPIETVAGTQQDATYIEVWPPYDTYRDLQQLILDARRLAPAKQVILAAYLKPLLGASSHDLPGAEAATLLAGAAIWANGGFHLLLGEHDGALCDPYYPKYAQMRPAFARLIRANYDFVVRYENVLSDRALVTATADQTVEGVRLPAVPVSAAGEAGSVWTILRDMPGLRTVNLINLTAMPTAEWNVTKQEPPLLPDLALDIAVPDGQQIEAVFAATPDRAGGRPESLSYLERVEGTRHVLTLKVPSLRYWTLIVMRLGQ